MHSLCKINIKSFFGAFKKIFDRTPNNKQLQLPSKNSTRLDITNSQFNDRIIVSPENQKKLEENKVQNMTNQKVNTIDDKEYVIYKSVNEWNSGTSNIDING